MSQILVISAAFKQRRKGRESHSILLLLGEGICLYSSWVLLAGLINQIDVRQINRRKTNLILYVQKPPNI